MLTSHEKEVMPHLTQEDETGDQKKRGLVASDRVKHILTKRDIRIAYAGVMLAFLAMSFQNYTTGVYTAYATSAFRSHSDLATAGVITRVLTAVGYALVPKIGDNIGRISPTLFSVFLGFNVIRDALMAGCKNVSQYIGASVFDGIGSAGWSMLMQIYIAETTSIISRGFWNVFPEAFGAIIAMYTGSEVGEVVLTKYGVQSGWRWGYGMFCIIVTVCALPFIGTLVWWQRRAAADDTAPVVPPHRKNIIYMLYHEYDIVGCCLFGAGISLVLVPITLAKGLAAKWSPSNVGMICTGFVLVILFILWSLPRRFRPAFLPAPEQPFLPWEVLRNRSAMALCAIQMADFCSYAIFTTYFQSYLQVAVRASPAQASRVDNTLRIVFQGVSIIIGALMRFWKPLCRKAGLGDRLFHTKYPILIGVPLCAIGIGLDIDFVQHPTRGTAIASFVIAKAIYGVGRAFIQTAGLVSMQIAVRRGELGVATGIFFTVMSVGGAIGVAIAGAIWNNVLPKTLLANLPPEVRGQATKIFGSIAVAQTYNPDSPAGIAIRDAYCHVAKYLAIAATCLQIPMLVAMFFVKDVLLEEHPANMKKPEEKDSVEKDSASKSHEGSVDTEAKTTV